MPSSAAAALLEARESDTSSSIVWRWPLSMGVMVLAEAGMGGRVGC